MRMYRFIASILFLSFVLSTTFSEDKKPVIVVSTFDTNSTQFTKEDLNGLSDLFINELTQSAKTFDVVDRANLDKIMAEVKFQQTDWSSSEKVAKLGEALNANWLVKGQILKIGSKSYFATTLIDVKTSRNINATKIEFSTIDNVIDNYPKIVSDLVSVLNTDNQSNQTNSKLVINSSNPFIGKWKDVDGSLSIVFNNDGTVIINRFQTIEIYNSHNNNVNKVTTFTGTGTYHLFSDSVEIELNLIAQNDNTPKKCTYKGKFEIDSSQKYLVLTEKQLMKKYISTEYPSGTEPDYIYYHEAFGYSTYNLGGSKKIRNPDAGKQKYGATTEITYFDKLYRD